MSRFVPCRKSLCSWYMHRVPPNGPMRRDVRNNPDVRSFSLSISFSFFPLSLLVSLSSSFSLTYPRYIRTASDWPWTYRRRRLRIRTQPSLPFHARDRSVHSACTEEGEGMRSIQLFFPVGSRESLYLPAAAAALSSRENSFNRVSPRCICARYVRNVFLRRNGA